MCHDCFVSPRLFERKEPFLRLQTVSVHQVKPPELTDFLQVKKSEGYCIVGVEQTANSRSLQDYQFPEKTLLLLGYDGVKYFSQITNSCALSCTQPMHKWMEAAFLPCDSGIGKSVS